MNPWHALGLIAAAFAAGAVAGAWWREATSLPPLPRPADPVQYGRQEGDEMTGEPLTIIDAEDVEVVVERVKQFTASKGVNRELLNQIKEMNARDNNRLLLNWLVEKGFIKTEVYEDPDFPGLLDFHFGVKSTLRLSQRRINEEVEP